MPEHYSPCSFLPTHCIILTHLTASDFIYLQKKKTSPVYNTQYTWNAFTWMWLPCAESRRYLWRRSLSVLSAPPHHLSLSLLLFDSLPRCGVFTELATFIGSPRQSVVLNDNGRAHMFKLKPSITPVGALVGRLTAALLRSAHLAPFLQELSSPSSSHLNNHQLLSGSVLRHSPPPFLTLYNAQHRAHRQWTELKCHKKHIHVPNVSSRQKALRLFSSLHNWRSAAHCCCSAPPPGRRDASQNEWEKCSLRRQRNVWMLLEVFPSQA